MIEILKVQTIGNCDMINITERIEKIIGKSKIKEGLVNIFVRHTTAGVVILEDENGMKKDFCLAFERIAPKNIQYNHNVMQNDDNGHSHIKGSIIGPTVSIPVKDGEMLLGTWQQVFLVDFDTNSREREVVVSVVKG